MHKSILTLCAILVEGFVAYEALPIVQHKYGIIAGAVFTAFIAIAIFYTWFLAFNAETKGRRFGAMFLALAVFIPLTMVSTYQSKMLPDLQAKQLANQESTLTLAERQNKADTDYSSAMKSHDKAVEDINGIWRDQERARMNSLAQVNKEIKATKKLKQPEIYAALLERQAELSTPYSRAEYPAKPERETIKPSVKVEAEKPEINLVALQSGLLSILTPIFLWLETGLPKTKKKKGSFGRWLTSFGANRQSFSMQPELDSNTRSGFTECPFQAKRIVTGTNGQVTVASIRAALRISDRQARKRQSEAVEAGYLVKKGNAYFYPEKNQFEAVELKVVSS